MLLASRLHLNVVRVDGYSASFCRKLYEIGIVSKQSKLCLYVACSFPSEVICFSSLECSFLVSMTGKAEAYVAHCQSIDAEEKNHRVI